MKVLAVDPGLTVGYAVYTEPGDDADYRIESGQDHKWTFLHYFSPMTWLTWVDVVVCERFTITPQTLKMSRQPHPIEVIGVLRWWCHKAEVPFIEQSPAEAKGFVTNDRLKSLGLYQPGQDHANDGLRHLVLYLVKSSLISAGDLVSEQS